MTRPPNPPYVGPAAHDSGLGNKPIKRIVIHCTVSPCEPGGARRIAEWFRNPASQGSAHYVVDPSEVVQVVHDSVIAWHAPPNDGSIGVELTDLLVSHEWDLAHADRWKDRDHRKMLARAARLVARLGLAYDVPLVHVGPRLLRAGRHGVTGHAAVAAAFRESSHWDPGVTFPWGSFMAAVRDRAKVLRERDQ